MLRTIIVKMRRTLTYFHCGSEQIVRAPQIRMPRLGRARIVLIPSLFNIARCASLSWTARSVTPSRGTLAGGLCTPTRRSHCVMIPQTTPLGGTARRLPPTSVTTHG